MMQKAKLLLLTITTIFAVSCASRVETVEKIDLNNGGAVRLNLSPSAALTKLRDVPTPSPEEFLITIASTTADENGDYPVVFEKQYGEMPLSVVLKEGEYSVTATSGAHETFSTTAPTYTATRNATVEIGQTTDISLTATISSYLVDIVYTEEFKKAFTDYYVEAHVMDDRYTFAAMGDQCAYFAPGSVKVVLKGTTAAGQAYSSVIKEISSIGRERYVLTLAIRPQGHAFDVLVDTQVEQIGVSGELDPDLYPDMPKPVVGELSFYETADKVVGDQNTMATVSSIVSIDDVELTFTEPNISTAGLEANRVYSLAVADDAAALTAAGVDFNAAIIGMRTATIDFSTLATKLLSYNNAQTTYPVTIKVTDKVQKSVQSEATIKINPPVFAMSTIDANNCWAHSTTIPNTIVGVSGKSNATTINSAPLKFQISTDGTTWNDVSSSTLSGLSANTTHYVRAIYRDNIPSLPAAFTTEQTTQLPNSGFEDWYNQKIFNASGMSRNINCYHPCTETQYNEGNRQWVSTNRQTTNKDGSGTVCQYKWYPGITSTSGQTGNAARIATIGRTASDNNVFNGGRDQACEWVDIGHLALGNYAANEMDMEYGIPFASRPTAVSFMYKYENYNDNTASAYAELWGTVNGNRELIGTTPVQFAVSSNISAFTQATINFQYSRTDIQATHISVHFISGNKTSTSTVKTIKGSYGASPWMDDRYEGAVLIVDDVELIYEK